MKKIMIAAMAVFAAVAANAAALKWGLGTVELAGGGTAGKNEVTGYLFLIVWALARPFATLLRKAPRFARRAT